MPLNVQGLCVYAWWMATSLQHLPCPIPACSVKYRYVLMGTSWPSFFCSGWCVACCHCYLSSLLQCDDPGAPLLFAPYFVLWYALVSHLVQRIFSSYLSVPTPCFSVFLFFLLPPLPSFFVLFLAFLPFCSAGFFVAEHHFVTLLSSFALFLFILHCTSMFTGGCPLRLCPTLLWFFSLTPLFLCSLIHHVFTLLCHCIDGVLSWLSCSDWPSGFFSFTQAFSSIVLFLINLDLLCKALCSFCGDVVVPAFALLKQC